MTDEPTTQSHQRQDASQDILVIGGGAAGFFGAITTAESNPNRNVTILEKSPDVLAKVKISGGGRCNVTHACFEPSELISHYPRGHRELLGPFHRWQPSDTVKWFESRGVPLKTESDGRMFPVSNQSACIVSCLLNTAKSAGVSILTRRTVSRIKRQGKLPFEVQTQDGHIFHAEHILWATGGLKLGPATNVLTQLGHHIIEPIPSLFTFKIQHPLIKGLQGLSVKEVEATIDNTNIHCRGPLLVTHWGLSGPAILRLSAWGARNIHAATQSFYCDINWLPQIKNVAESLRAITQQDPNKQIQNLSPCGLPKRLWQSMLTFLKFRPGMTWRQLNQKQIIQLADQLKKTRFEVTGKSRNKEEFVTCGGIDLKEVHFKTMESRIVPGLHFAGEVLDIDAETGGFNFQSAWTTGYIAGKAMAED